MKQNLKLNLGCGSDYREGWVNVDRDAARVDVKHDLNRHPYPFKRGSAEIILLRESLAYVADLRKFFLECERILAPGGKIYIEEFHGSHSHAYSDAGYAHRGFGLHSFDQLYKLDKRITLVPAYHEFAFAGCTCRWPRDPAQKIRFLHEINNWKIFAPESVINFVERWVSPIIPFEKVRIILMRKSEINREQCKHVIPEPGCKSCKAKEEAGA